MDKNNVLILLSILLTIMHISLYMAISMDGVIKFFVILLIAYAGILGILMAYL